MTKAMNIISILFLSDICIFPLFYASRKRLMDIILPHAPMLTPSAMKIIIRFLDR